MGRNITIEKIILRQNSWLFVNYYLYILFILWVKWSKKYSGTRKNIKIKINKNENK